VERGRDPRGGGGSRSYLGIPGQLRRRQQQGLPQQRR
jgi:hypothetical protein